MEIRITKGDGWYEKAVGAVYVVDAEFFSTDAGWIYYIDPEDTRGGRRFVRAADCEVIQDTKQAVVNPPVKVGDYVQILGSEECPESVGRCGTVLRTSTAAESDFDVDIPSKVYGYYTWVDADCDRWVIISEAESETAGSDVVSSPQHYTQGRTEVIDIIEDATQGAEGIEAVCQANVIKYIMRYRHKNGAEDLHKAKKYLDWLVRHLNGEPRR